MKIREGDSMKLKYLLFPIVIINSGLFAYQNFHGCCLASDNLTGWAVTLDSIIVLKTADGGAYWQEQTNSAATRKFFDITCRDNLKAWTCGILGEITYTNNGGQNWTHQVQGLAKYATRIEFIDDTLGWTVCGDAVVGKTIDGGSYWEQIFITNLPRMELYGVSFVNEREGWVVAGWPDSLYANQGWIIHSSDGGFVWDSLYCSNGYENFFDVYFFNNTDGIVVGGNEQDYAPIIWKTTNGGNSWNPYSAPANAFYLRALDFVDSLNGWAVGRFGTIIHTTDGGSSWIFQTNPATTTLFDVDFSDVQHGIACGDGIILYTDNGGQTWQIGQIEGIAENTEASRLDAKELRVYPNPFQNATTIKFQIPSRVEPRCETNTKSQTNSNSEFRNSQSEISLRIYDAMGRLVKQFNHLTIKPFNQISWFGKDDYGRKVPSGVYFIRLETKDFSTVEKAILLR